MITISIDPIIFQIGHFALRWYGLIVLAAIQVGIWLIARELDARNSEKKISMVQFSGLSVLVRLGPSLPCS
jgi:prolipoprotein diacylglyceryltransferase